ncbi:MAG: hypothetical protein IDH49_11800 [Gammaproteobacteria bacterium]|nr:hypothetical protein [Gammaproteobacteria bacterium]
MTEKSREVMLGAQGGQGSSHGRSRKSRRSESGRRRISQRLILAIALGVALLALVVESVLTGTRITNLSRENNILRGELVEVKSQLAKALPELKQTQRELEDMIKDRMPHLRPIEPDKVVNINDGYVKNILFSVLKTNSNKKYEYKLVMENKTGLSLHPQVQIFVFDNHGVQIGMAEINERLELLPGESRSQSAAIRFFIDAEPHFFLTRASNRSG